MKAIFEYIHGILNLATMSGLKERVNPRSSLLWISLWVQLTLWKNHRWSLPIPCFPSLLSTTLWIKSPAICQMMELPCLHLNLLLKHLNLQGSGYHSAKNLQLNHVHLSFTLHRRLTIWRIKCNLLLSRNVEQWR